MSAKQKPKQQGMSNDSAEIELSNEIARFQHDPLGFVLFAFPWGEGELVGDMGSPDTWQVEILQEIGEKLRTQKITNVYEAILEAVASGHGIGKSALVAWIILWAISTMEDTRGVVTAMTETQLKTKTWSELNKWYRMLICRHWFHCTATSIYSTDPLHEKTWRIDMVPWSDKNTEAFAGLHNLGKRILLIMDEASGIDDLIWEISEGALTDKGTEIIWLAFGNPTRNIGRFKDCFTRFKAYWKIRQIDSRDVRITNKRELQKMIDKYGIDSDIVKVRIRGMFPNTSVRQYISQVDVDAGYGKHLRKEEYEFAPVILTLDNAWEGDDEVVISKRQGLLFEILFTCEKNDNDHIIGAKLLHFEDEHKADAVFIDGGFGTGVASFGRTNGREWQLVWFNEASSKAGFANKRAEMCDEARIWLKQGGAYPPDTIMYNEFACYQTVARNDGVVQLLSKKEVKSLLKLTSPNRVDSLLLSFAYPVMRKNTSPLNVYGVQTSVRPYDPFDENNRIVVANSVREYTIPG